MSDQPDIGDLGELIATMNHELRTPLTNILGYTEVLLEDDSWDLPTTHREVIERIHRNAVRMHHYISELELLRSRIPPGA